MNEISPPGIDLDDSTGVRCFDSAVIGVQCHRRKGHAPDTVYRDFAHDPPRETVINHATIRWGKWYAW